jgi:hypothetical protein
VAGIRQNSAAAAPCLASGCGKFAQLSASLRTGRRYSPEYHTLVHPHETLRCRCSEENTSAVLNEPGTNIRVQINEGTNSTQLITPRFAEYFAIN